MMKDRLQPPQMPTSVNKLLLLDKDLTLVDRSYTLTDNRIYRAIEDMQSNGWDIGLSSDTPLDTLQRLHGELGLSGPIIAERGAITYHNEETIFNAEDIGVFTQSRLEMAALLGQSGIPVEIYSGLDMGENLNLTGDPYGRKTFFMQSRMLSIGMFFRSYDEDGHPFIDDDFSTQTADALRHNYPPFDDLFVDLNHEYGILILSRQEIDKRYATRNHMLRNGYTQIGMVGNSISDYVGNDIALHYAVGNSTNEFKERADYVASKPMTSGVIEILEKLGNN